jgi:hypothetical protein
MPSHPVADVQAPSGSQRPRESLLRSLYLGLCVTFFGWGGDWYWLILCCKLDVESQIGLCWASREPMRPLSGLRGPGHSLTSCMPHGSV